MGKHGPDPEETAASGERMSQLASEGTMPAMGAEGKKQAMELSNPLTPTPVDTHQATGELKQSSVP